MGWFSDVVDAVGDAIEDAANAVGEAVSDAVETVGNAIEDALDWLGGDVPIWSDILGWLGGVISGVFDFVGAVIKGVLGFIGGLLGGLVKVVGGILSLNGGLILEGLGDIFSSLAGALILIVGKFISLVQTILPFQAKERRLSKEEVALLQRVFCKSIAYYNVRLIEGRAGLFGLNARPFTLGNTIYLKSRNVSTDPGLLVHEVTHVWQYQNHGARYASDAIYAQWFVDNEYSWEAEVNRGNLLWLDFNREAQASFIEDIFNDGELLTGGTVTATGNGAFFDADDSATTGRFMVGAVDHTARANNAADIICNDGSQRLSGFID